MERMLLENKNIVKKERHYRSATKSILWRILGVIVLATVTYVITRNWIQTGLVTVIHHASFLIIYYLHERAWCRVKNCTGRKRKIFRAFTYEIILGHLVLGLITWAVTGNWLDVTLVTVIYIENKLWIYYVYDWVWDRVSWGLVEPLKVDELV